MTNIDTCDFCTLAPPTGDRVIRSNDLIASLVSNPSFRADQCLVIPRRHIETLDELTDEEAVAIIRELGRLAKILDTGFGSGIIQKFQPAKVENGITMKHLHFHVLPRIAEEPGILPVPVPNSPEGFTRLDNDEVNTRAEELR